MKSLQNKMFFGGGSVKEIDPDIRNYYRCDSNFIDRVGSANGLGSNINYEVGKVGNSVRLLGLNTSFVEFDGNDFVFGNGTIDIPFSVSFWIKLNSTGTKFIINKRSGTNVCEFQIALLSGIIQINLYSNGSPSNYIGKKLATSPSLSTWHHITITYNGNSLSSGINLYLNGILNNGANVNAGTYVAMQNTGIPMELGIARITNASLDGNLDCLTWFNSGISSSKALENYNKVLTEDLA